MTKRPNFLYIMVDQMRADWLGCAGHPVVRTPNIDALAASGTVFSQCHVASPVCMPNRASFMTGRYPSVHGLRFNGVPLSPDAQTFADVLRGTGYATASIGKSHLQPFTGISPKPAIPDPEGPVAEAWRAAPHKGDHEEPERYQSDIEYDLPKPYYGFDHVDMVTGHGDRAQGHYMQWLRRAHPDWRDLTDPASELPHAYSCPQAYRTPIPEEFYPTAFIRDRACTYLQSRAGADAPFFAYVSFPDPHHPFNPPGRYWDMYDPEDFELPSRFEDHENPPPPLADAQRMFKAGVPARTPQTAFMAHERQIKEAMALTAGMITMIDDAVGTLVAELKAQGLYEDTVIVFNADHGDYMGDMGLLLKGAWARDSINRVPLIWSDPEHRNAASSDALVSTVDLAATILDRAGTAPYVGMQGRSFRGCVAGEPGTHRDSVLVEFNDGLLRMGFERPARVRTVVTADWQLSVYKTEDWGELYDRRNDPLQARNLWDCPDHAGVKATLFEDLAHHLMDQMDESPRPARLA